MANTPINSLINLALPSTPPGNFTDDQVRAAVEIFLTSFHNFLRDIEKYCGITQKDPSLWTTLLPSETLLQHQLGRLYVTASENLINGDLVNLHNVAGALRVRKARAAAGDVRPANGFCSTDGGILNGERGEIIVGTGIVPITGVNPADRLFLSTSVGQATTVAPAGAGQLEQFVGIGVATNVALITITQGPYIQH